MKTLALRFSLFACLSFIGMGFYFHNLPVGQAEEKLKPEEIVARHLEAIGKADVRQTMKSLAVQGLVKMESLVGKKGSTSGEALMASTGTKFYCGFRFPLPDYTGEDLVFDGVNPATGFLPLGKRSNLSLFVNAQDIVLKEGLIGGTLSTAWPLHRVAELQPRLEHRGLKKIDDRQLHEVSYRAKKGQDTLRIQLYFDPANFRHVRTEYVYESSQGIGRGVGQSAGQSENHYKLIETFDDFRVLAGLTLPHKYELQLRTQTNSATVLLNWQVEAARVFVNEAIDEQLFKTK